MRLHERTLMQNSNAQTALLRSIEQKLEALLASPIAPIASQPRRAQRQDSVTDQLLDVAKAANEMGCYDAADWIMDRIRPERVQRGEGA
jgi:hypothetical protein